MKESLREIPIDRKKKCIIDDIKKAPSDVFFIDIARGFFEALNLKAYFLPFFFLRKAAFFSIERFDFAAK